MENLSLDEVFHMMEFLPINELASALLVCKEWHSLDQYEPFWKTILEHYLVSNIIDVVGRMETEHGAKNSKLDEENIRKIKSGGNLNERFKIVSSLKGIKTKDHTTHCKIDRSILNTLIGSFTNHILKDKTASRQSLQKFIIQVETSNEDETISSESKRTSVTGKRFKYLTEKQVYSKMLITSSLYFEHVYEIDSRTFIQSMISSISGKEYQLSDDYMCSIGKKAFTFFFKYHEKIQNSEKIWNYILSKCIENFPEDFPTQEDCELVLKKIFEYTKPFNLVLLEELLFRKSDEYFQNKVFPLIIQLFERNGLEGKPEKFPIAYLRSMNDEQFATRFVEFLEYVRKLTNLEIQRYEKFVVISALLANRYGLVDEILKLHPIDLVETIPYDSVIMYNSIEPFLEYTKQRGILLPLEYVSNIATNMIMKSCSRTSRAHWISLRYILDNYMDIYELEKNFSFLKDVFSSNFSFNSAETLLSNETEIEWEKLAEINNNASYIRERIARCVNGCFKSFQFPLLSIIKKQFKPDVFDLDLLDKVLDDNYYLARYSECRSEIFNRTMFSENETLCEKIDKMKREQDWTNFKEVDFRIYDKSDPKYLMALYNHMNEFKEEEGEDEEN